MTVARAIIFILALAVPAGAVDRAAHCRAAKLKAAGIKARGLVGCYVKYLDDGDAEQLAACQSGADARFMQAFATAEARGGCATVGDATGVEAGVDAGVDVVVARAAYGPCAPLFLRIAGKKARALLEAYARDALRPGVLAAALAKAQAAFRSRFDGVVKHGCPGIFIADALEAAVDNLLVRALETCGNGALDFGEECDPSVEPGYCGLPGTGHECLRCQLAGPGFSCNTDDHPSACCGGCAAPFGGPGFCAGGACTQAADCGTGCCVAGQCTGSQGVLCAGDGTCCPGFLCRGSFANTRCCAGPGAPCTDDVQCCVSGSCNQTTMTCDATSTSTSVTLPCPTTTTLGVPNCGGVPGFCLGPCLTGQTCTDEGGGSCACTGPVVCGGAYNTCGGECALGQSCVPIAVPSGCPAVGCSCQ